LSADWRNLARRADLALTPADTTRIELQGGSTQAVELREHADSKTLRARSVIASRKTLAEASSDVEPLLYAWHRNRLSDLVGFTIDGKGRLVGEAWIPLEGLTPGELKLYLQELARVCDWHEFRLTAEDVY
jgi:hypothetical protein